MRAFLITLLFMVLSGAPIVPSAQLACDCMHHQELVGECFVVHGRISFYNGNPTARIWVIGSKRMLGVSDQKGCSLPDNVQALMNWETEVYGDFTVCPFSISKPGEMQLVCVAQANHLVAKKRH